MHRFLCMYIYKCMYNCIYIYISERGRGLKVKYEIKRGDQVFISSFTRFRPPPLPVTPPTRPRLRPPLFQTVRHGFPYQPSAMAFDPVQKILAVGTQTGALRLYPLTGRRGSPRGPPEATAGRQADALRSRRGSLGAYVLWSFDRSRTPRLQVAPCGQKKEVLRRGLILQGFAGLSWIWDVH